MVNFFMLTRGRTGSTAILDELQTTNIFSLQEIFVELNTPGNRGHSSEETISFPSFDLWLTTARPPSVPNRVHKDKPKALNDWTNSLNLSLKTISEFIQRLDRNNSMLNRSIERYFLMKYLDDIENHGKGLDKIGTIFKVLSHQLSTRRPLLGVLKKRGYKAILLTRRNVVKQVLSGMVAEARGVYNTRQFSTMPPCKIDLARFEFAIAWELKCNEENRSLLMGNDIDFIELAYEDFVKDREFFYSNLFEFMKIDSQTPQPTNYSVMIPDMKSAIINYQDVEKKITSMFSPH